METRELDTVLRQGEGISIEFKRCGSLPERDTFESICSFANRQGGNIFLGVLNNGTVVGVDKKRCLEIQRNIVNTINNPTLFNVAPALELEEITYRDATVIRIWVPVSSIVHRFKGIVYDRSSDADIKIETDTQLAALYIRKQEYYSERKVYRYLKKEDLRLDLLPRVRSMARAKRTNHPWATLDDDTLLRSANLYLKDYTTGEEGFTLAGALLLGRDEVISSINPTYRTDAYVQLDDKDRYDDRLVVRTNLIEAYDALLGFVQKHLPDRFFLEGTQAVSLRDIIARELITNTLMHREYTSPLPAKLVIDGNGIRTENANRPRFIGVLSPDRFNPLPKNPIIADFFSNIGLAESLGSGTRNLFKYSWIYGGEKPILREGDVFTALVPFQNRDAAQGKGRDVDETITFMLTSYGYVNIATVADIAGVTERTVRRHISPLVKSGKLIATGSTKDRRYIPASSDADSTRQPDI